MCDHYDVLGISKTATHEEIKKAHRELIMIWHPDKKKSDENNQHTVEVVEKKFREITTAYSILSDPTKREQYDKFNTSNVNQNTLQTFDPSHSIDKMFEDGEVPPVIVHVECNMIEAYTGIEKNIVFRRFSPCDECDGTGTFHKKISNCTQCNGLGRMVKTMEGGRMGFVINEIECEQCNGLGIDPEDEKCHDCQGKRYLVEEVEYDLMIHSGAHNQEVIYLKDEGNYIPENERKTESSRSDVLFVISTPTQQHIDHMEYKRGVYIDRLRAIDHYNLMIDMEISLAESLCGFYREIKHINGDVLKIKSDDIVLNNDLRVICGKGMQKNGKLNNNDDVEKEYGDLLIKFTIKKDVLDKKQKRRLWQILTNTGFNKEMTKKGDQLMDFDKWIDMMKEDNV